MRATKESWKNIPMSKDREKLPFEEFYSDLDAENMKNGYIPEEMEDKWFIYFHEGWLYFHRSWTGHCIFMVKLDGSPAGVRVVESWVTRDSSQYNSDGLESDISILSSLIMSKLIRPDDERKA